MRDRGAALALVDLDAEALEAAAAELGDGALAIPGDASDPESLQAAVRSVVERFGGLDCVVANAGLAPRPSTVRTIDVEEFERVVEVDLLGVWRTVRAALPQIVERRGQVVLLASVYSFMNGAFASPYAVSKAGVEALGRALRVELAPHGAGVTLVHPGFIDTKMVRDTLEDPIALECEGRLPGFMTRRITPERIAASIVEAVERRAPRVIRPRWWGVYQALRGVLNPATDAALVHDRRFAEIVERAES